MKKYVDGFVLVVPKKKLSVYKKMAELGKRVWTEHGAIQYVESVGDDLKVMKGMRSFPKLASAKSTDVVLFSWIMYKSKAHRNEVNKKVMKDKRMKAFMNGQMPFDMKKMSYGGFSIIVQK